MQFYQNVASAKRQSFESEQEQRLFILYISEDDKDKEMLWIIIVASVGGAIVLVVVVVVAWCVHHKGKCRRKGSKGGYSFLVKEWIEVVHGSYRI